MELIKLTLENFRNYRKINVEFNSRLVLILGDNASGKTNFLESLYFLSTLKSFRGGDHLLVKTGEDYFKIESRSATQDWEAVIQLNPAFRRQFKINGQKKNRLFWHTFRTVLFEPSHLNLFILGPSARRAFLDETLSQKHKEYLADRASLEHILKQRAALLGFIVANEAGIEELSFWNEQLAPVSLRIAAARTEYLDFLNNNFVPLYSKLTGFGSQFKIEYQGIDPKLSEEGFLEELKKHQEAEVKSGRNLFGPHRDDFKIHKDDQLNLSNSSRGELREQVLTLKLLQARYLVSGLDKPVILLDDVFSELDEERRAKLLENFALHQVFITSTEEHHLPKLKNAQILHVANDEIE